MSKDSHSKRPVVIVAIVGSIIVISLMLGVTFLQAGSNVSEVSISSTSSYLTSSSSTNSKVDSSSSSSSSTTSSSTYTGPTGMLGVSLTDPPIVPPGVTDIYISYSSVQVHVGDAGNQDGWYRVADSGSVDLMSLINVSLTLGSAQVQTGVFNLISFNITSAAVTLNGANITAYVPANRINVPIVGGIAVNTGNTSGVLVDLSPEVVPYENGTSVSYVLVPEARSLPIPNYVWNRDLEIKGAKLKEIQNQTWVTNATGQVVVTGVSVAPNSFSLTLQNQGTSNAIFSSIVVGQVMSLPVCYATPSSGSPRPDVSNVSTYISVKPGQSYYEGNMTVYLLGQVYPSPSSTDTNASILVTDPNGSVVESLVSLIELSGAFHAVFTAGGSGLPWIGGLYNVTVNYNGTEGRASFEWSSAATIVSTTSSLSSSSTSTSVIESAFTETTTTSTTTETYTIGPHQNIIVMTNATQYFGNEGVLVSGQITPPPTASDFALNIRVIGPDRQYVYDGPIEVGSDGSFSVAFPAGNPVNVSSTNQRPIWTNGTYLVYAYRDGLVVSTKFEWNGTGSVITSWTESTTTWTSSSYSISTDPSHNSTYQFQSSFCSLYSNQDRSKLPPSISVAYYAIFSNGTLYPVNYTSMILYVQSHSYQERHDGSYNASSGNVVKSPLTFVLAPGQSVTFTYNGKIDSLNGALLSYMPRNFAVPSFLFQINVGQEYSVIASGPFDVRVATLVNATFTG
jgi:hypothetical protein